MKSKTLLGGLEMLSLPVKECKLWPGSVLFCWGVLCVMEPALSQDSGKLGVSVMCLCES